MSYEPLGKRLFFLSLINIFSSLIIPTDNDDDGETAAGSRLLHLMSILDVKNVVVVVSRWVSKGALHGELE